MSDTATMAVKPRYIVIGALLLLAVALPPWFGSSHHYLASLALSNISMAVGLNIMTGNAGQLWLGN